MFSQVGSCQKINKELVADSKKVDTAARKAAKEHAQILKKTDDLKTQLAESEKARAKMDGLRIRLAESEKARAEAQTARTDPKALSKATELLLQESKKACRDLS
jgi:hypothetical protein